jgi:hypothetical protein
MILTHIRTYLKFPVKAQASNNNNECLGETLFIQGETKPCKSLLAQIQKITFKFATLVRIAEPDVDLLLKIIFMNTSTFKQNNF